MATTRDGCRWIRLNNYLYLPTMAVWYSLFTLLVSVLHNQALSLPSLPVCRAIFYPSARRLGRKSVPGTLWVYRRREST